MKKSCCHIAFTRRLLTEHEVTLDNGNPGYVTMWHHAGVKHPHRDPYFQVMVTDLKAEYPLREQEATNTMLGSTTINDWVDSHPEQYGKLPKTHLDWLEREYNEAVAEANLPEDDLYWFAEDEDIVCRNRTDNNREWYRIPYQTLQTKAEMLKWVDRIQHKSWLTPQNILQFVDTWEGWMGVTHG